MVLNVRDSMFATLVLLSGCAAAQAASAPPIDYALDLPRSSLKFTFTQDKAENQGRFRKYDVAFKYAEANLPASKLDVVISMDSLDTGDEQRDGEMKGVNGFDVAKFPEAKFHATKLTMVSAGRYEAIGKLTLHGVSHDLRVPLSIRAATEKSGQAAYLTGRVSFNRLDYGVGQGQYKATDFMGNEVSATFGLRLMAKTAEPAKSAASGKPAAAPAAAK